MENYDEKTEIEFLKKEISSKKISEREKELLKKANEASQIEKEALNEYNEVMEQLEKLKMKYNLSENAFNKLMNSKEVQEGIRAAKLRNDIDNYVKTLSKEERKNIERLQKYLTNYDENYKFEDNKIKMSFSYTFGDKIDNKKFVSFIEQGLSNLYSSDKEISKNVFKFFQDIEKKI